MKILSAFTLAFALAACVPATEAQTRTTTDTKGMKVKITLDNQEHYATLADNPASRSLMAQLPFTLPLEDYAASEKIARLSFKLDIAQAPVRYQGKAGDITYYAPWGNLALFYKGGDDAGGLIYLGKFEGDFQALVTANHITMEMAE